MKAVQVQKTLAKAALAAARKELPPDEPKAETPAPVTEVTPVEETPTPAPVESKPAIPHGAEMLQQAHAHLSEWISYCDQELPRLENDDVSALLLGICEETLESIATICDTYAAQYPDLEPLPEVSGDEEEAEPAEGEEGKDDDTDAEAEGDDEETKDDDAAPPEPGKSLPTPRPGKSYSGGIKRLTKAMGSTIKECADHLTEMKDAENLTSGQKLVCKHYAKELGSMCAEKEEAVVESKDDEPGEDDIEKAYDALSPEDQKAFDQELAVWVEQQEAADRRAEAQATHDARLATAAQRRASWR